jgi:hypothetical protein
MFVVLFLRGSSTYPRAGRSRIGELVARSSASTRIPKVRREATSVKKSLAPLTTGVDPDDRASETTRHLTKVSDLFRTRDYLSGDAAQACLAEVSADEIACFAIDDHRLKAPGAR